MPNFPASATSLPETFADATTSASNHPGAHNQTNDEVNAIGDTLLGTLAGTLTFTHQDKGGQVYNVKSYGATGNGTTDDSTSIASAVSAANAAGGGTVYFPFGTYAAKNIIIYPNVIYELGGSIVKLHSSGTNSDDVFRTNNFATLTGTTGNSLTGGAPYRFQIRNGTVQQPTTNTGRHCIAIYGISYELRNLLIIGNGVGSPLWTEWGASSEDFFSSAANWTRSDNAAYFNRIVIIDGTSTASVNTLPAANDVIVNVTGVTNVLNPTITVDKHHYLTVGQAITIASVGGATGVNGARTVASIPSSTTFTISVAAPGVYTSGGTVSNHVSAAWTHLGATDCQANAIILAGMTNVAGRRGIMIGNNGAGGASGTGISFANLHIYLNFNVGLDTLSGNTLIDHTCQIEGSTKCLVLMRTGGQSKMLAQLFSSAGGATALDCRDGTGQNRIDARIFNLGLGAAPASGFNNTAFANWGANIGSTIDIDMFHGYNTNVACTAGTAPSLPNRINMLMNAYGITTATMTAGWMTGIDATHAGLARIQTGLTWTTG